MSGGLFYINPSKATKRDTYYEGDEAIPEPTWKTAYSKGYNIVHFTGVRIRALGNGNLQLKAYTLNNTRSVTLTPLPLSSTTDIIPTRLCNLTTQRASLEGKVAALDEFFKITGIVLYAKEVAQSYPG